MKSAREAGHRLTEKLKKHCAGERGDEHSPDCDEATAVIESRDREHAGEVHTLRVQFAAEQEARKMTTRCWENAEAEVERLRAELAEVKADRDSLFTASLATVTDDRDVARSQLASERETALAILECAKDWERRFNKAEAALAASVRREDVVRWLRWVNDSRRYPQAMEAGRIADGSWLRDLTTMDGRPAGSLWTTVPDPSATVAKVDLSVTADEVRAAVERSKDRVAAFNQENRSESAVCVKCAGTKTDRQGRACRYCSWKFARPNKETDNG